MKSCSKSDSVFEFDLLLKVEFNFRNRSNRAPLRARVNHNFPPNQNLPLIRLIDSN
jgi:hypothetical protein